MKKFIGKTLYLMAAGFASMVSSLGERRVISEKTMWTGISKAVDVMDFAVHRLMKQNSYKNFTQRVNIE